MFVNKYHLYPNTLLIFPSQLVFDLQTSTFVSSSMSLLETCLGRGHLLCHLVCHITLVELGEHIQCSRLIESKLFKLFFYIGVLG